MKYQLVLIFLGASLAFGDERPAQVVETEIDLLAIPIADPVHEGHADHDHDHNEDQEEDNADNRHAVHAHGEKCDGHDHANVASGTVDSCEHDGHGDHASDSGSHDHSAHRADAGHSDHSAHAGHEHHPIDGHEDHPDHPWYEGDCNGFDPDYPNIGGFLFPSLSVYGAFGGSSGDQEELASSHHDPQSGATLQSLEPSLTLQGGQVRGFATGSGNTDAHGDFDFSIEEAYLGLFDLPGGVEVRGGRFLNPFGFQNARHNHDWNFVDQNLVNGRFLNEGEITTEGAEIVFPVAKSARARAYYGGVASHDHHHYHHEEEHLAFEGEGAEIRDRMFGVTFESELRIDDRSSLAAVASGLWGDNAFERHTNVYGGGLEYRTTHNDRPLRIRGEAMFREVDAVAGHLPGESEEEHEDHEEDHDHEEHEEHEEIAGLYSDGDHATFDEFGFSAAILYGLTDCTEIGIRADCISGIDEFGLDDRFRVSPVLTWYANEARTLQCRLQYNHDISESFGTENSVWFQVGMNWPGHHAH